MATRSERWRSRVLEYLICAGVVVGACILFVFPRRLVWQIGRACGWIGYYLHPEGRRIAEANLKIAFGETLSASERKRVARRSLQNFVATVVTLFWSPRISAGNLSRYADLDPASFARMKELAAAGQGIICLSLHYGDWELLGLAMPLLGLPLTLAVQETGVRGLDQLLVWFRSRTGNQIVTAGRGGLARLYHAIRARGFPTVVNDLNARPDSGVWVDFFGLPALNHATPAALAIHSGAPIMYGLAHPDRSGHVLLEWVEVPYSLSGDRERDLVSITEACARLCERLIKARPKLWHWAYKRWKRRPTEEQGAYPFYSKYKPR